MLSWFQKSSVAAIPLAVAALLWAGSIGNTVATQGQDINGAKTDITQMRELTARIDERLKALKEGQDRIERLLRP